MLRSALRKDLLLNAKTLWGMIPWFGWAAYAVGEPGAGRMLAVGSAFIGSLMTAAVGAREDKLRTTPTLASLPVSRAALVQARYVGAYVIGFGGYAVVVLLTLLPWAADPVSRLTEARTVLLTLTLASGAIAIMMPVTTRFGLVGVMVFLGVFQLLGVAVLLAHELFGLRSGLGLISAVERGIVSLYHSFDQAGATALTMLVLCGALWVSYRLSVFLAMRREL